MLYGATEECSICHPKTRVNNIFFFSGILRVHGVLGDEKRWYEPTPSGQYYWPSKANSDYSVESYVEMFAMKGFEVCDNADFEAGFEKIAIYMTKGEFTHVALQLPTGRWTSKLGGLEDIEHDTLKALEGVNYGKPARFMKRAVAEPRLV